MGNGRETAVCVGREVDAGCGGLEVEDCANEGRVLVGVAVVFLSCPGTGFEVVYAGGVFAPDCLAALSTLYVSSGEVLEIVEGRGSSQSSGICCIAPSWYG